VSVPAIVLIVAGIVMIGAGWGRARGPWRRYQELKAQDENIARYEAWRGGTRDTGRSGASVAMEVLRRQTRAGVSIAVVGFVLVLAGFLFR
jgi:hypothetical protein